MLSRVGHTIRTHRLFDRGDRLLVAVSGGSDSMALLTVLWELQRRLDLHLEVATVDHGLRPDVGKEIALVAERAAALGLIHHVSSVDVAGARRSAASGRAGVQESARRLRLGALAELAARRGLRRVALGHQADDQAETVLFRIVRGTGLRGLAGIPYRRDPFVRPLLDVTREETLRYLRKRGVPFVTDPSNEDRRYARSRIRHDLMPLLRRENPRVAEALRFLAQSAAAAVPERDEVAAAIGAAEAEGLHLPRRTAIAVSAAGRQGGTRRFDVAGGHITVSYGRIVASRAAAASVPPSASSSSPGARARRPRRRLGDVPGDGAEPGLGIMRGAAPSVYTLGDGRRLAVRECEGAPPLESDWTWFDAERLAWPLLFRIPRPGDRMRPRGGRGSKRLARLMIDAKIPQPERERLPVLTSADGAVLFVPGLRPSEVGRPVEATVRWLGVAWLPAPDAQPVPRSAKPSDPSNPADSLRAAGHIDPAIFGGNT
jgi:tRNA(Ile)-lysidine synthase